MAERTILPFGEAVLRKVAKPVTRFDERTWRLLDDMADTLQADEGRAGLAAPQIGILRRAIVMVSEDGILELINPEILEMSGEQVGPEACLSFLGYAGIVKRAKYVKIKTQDRNGKEHILEGKGHLARCIQHEIDHLNGILFIDHVKEDHLYHQRTKKTISLLDVIRLSNSQT
ncbi:peptide deformylase [Shimazuella sp. AN120528]|uniref:peptide deformylase n=1 Tax=Shimazuella soli TaxID=1892854 RepID=UPI001F0DA72C|nr:peptide deformylase [Shimazuella soli]MCH5584613.1 peptide deformylase [Shimazuella soli]